jgi:uncharacterized protein YdaU (DUF1376 family)
MLNVERLLASELWALTKEAPLAFRGAVGLWARAWKQIPPASLPNNEAVIAAFADMPLAKFRKLRDLVMRNFVLCSDGRYYHTKLAEEANKIWPSVAKKRREREADNERLKQWREKKKADREAASETHNETLVETRFETDKKPVPNGVDTDRDTDTDRDITSKKQDSPQPSAAPKGKRLRRSLPEVFPLEGDKDWAREHWLKKGRVDLCDAMTEEIQRFRDHHTSNATASADWPASWRTWVGNAMKFNKVPSNQQHGGRNGGRPNHTSSISQAADERSYEGLFAEGSGAPVLAALEDRSGRDRGEDDGLGRTADAA